MKYVIMCGRDYSGSAIPKQLWKVGNERIVERTIRLLRENGVNDIYISTNDDRFEMLGVPLLRHENEGSWVNGFYPLDEPVCYVFGDVVFSPNAVQKIVGCGTEDIEFFASSPPFAKGYPKRWAEPFAFKVVNTTRFRECVEKVKEGIQQGIWKREPIAWELWQVIEGHEPNKIDYKSYVAINDYTCDCDTLDDVLYFQERFKQWQNT